MALTRAVVLALLTAFAGFGAAAQGPSFDASTVGAPLSGARAELFMPAATPAAAVIVLHGCDGVGPHYRGWSRQLAQWGHAALMIDSFRPRGFTEVCNHGELVPPEVQARDAFDAAAYLRASLHVTKVGVIGFSHGGWAVLKAVLAGVVSRPGEPAFDAAVAFYPGCDPPTAALATDTLILIGEADDWTPVARCRRWVDLAQPDGHALQIKTYPGALHGFDAPAMPHDYAGHHVGRDPAAAADATAATQAFFAARLRP